MSNFNENSENREERVTLDDLLQLKRYERPPEDFWDDFEVVVKERTLQSVVTKKTWFKALLSAISRSWALRLSSGLGLAGVIIFCVVLFHPNNSLMEEGNSITVESGDDSRKDNVIEGEAPDEVKFIDVELALADSQTVGDKVEFIEVTLTLNESKVAEFDTVLSSNDLPDDTSDFVTYAGANISTVLAESESHDPSGSL